MRKNARWVDGKIKCGKCNQVKPTSDYHKNSSRVDGYAGHCKACAGIYPARKKTGNGQQTTPRGSRPQKRLVDPEKEWLKARWKYFSNRAFEKNLSFSFTPEELGCLVKQPCCYCGGFAGSGINGLDRVNNDSGYTKENCVSCCGTCNQMKFTHDLDFFTAHILKITKYLKIE